MDYFVVGLVARSSRRRRPVWLKRRSISLRRGASAGSPRGPGVEGIPPQCLPWRITNVSPAGRECGPGRTVIGEAAGMGSGETWRPAVRANFLFPSRRLRRLRVTVSRSTGSHAKHPDRAARYRVSASSRCQQGYNSPGRTVVTQSGPGHCRRGVLGSAPVGRWIAFVTFCGPRRRQPPGDLGANCCSAFRFPRVVTCPAPARRRH